jgi:hypothetical protein
MITTALQDYRQLINNAGQYTVPVIHFNGSGCKNLHEQYQRAATQLEQFRDAFQAIDFHPRDYYPLGDDAFHRARLERDEIRHAIWVIQDYLDQHLAQVDPRAQR